MARWQDEQEATADGPRRVIASALAAVALVAATVIGAAVLIDRGGNEVLPPPTPVPSTTTVTAGP